MIMTVTIMCQSLVSSADYARGASAWGPRGYIACGYTSGLSFATSTMHRLYSRPTALKSILALASGSVLTYHASDARRNRLSLQKDSGPTPAEQQFRTSSRFQTPPSLNLKRWEIRNDYPTQPPSDASSPSSAPWLQIDFRTDPEAYADAVRSYCFEGMVQSDFDARKCLVSI
jgi:hypothetical protein